MAHLRVYRDALPGDTSGVEIVAGSDSIDMSGLYPSGAADGSSKYVVVPLCLRCDVGFKATSVIISQINAPKAIIVSNLCKTLADYSSMIPNTYFVQSYSPYNIGEVDNTNVMFFVLGLVGYLETTLTETINALNISFVEIATS